jgi:acyl carrier protein
LIGAIDQYYGINISGEELMGVVFVRDICEMISTKMNLSKVK